MSDHDAHGEINISRVPASGIGGLGLVAMAGGIAWFIPELRWLAFIALAGGVAVGLTLIGVRNRRVRNAVALAGVALAVAVAGFLLFMFFI
jgi:hypothetical protein